MQLATAIGTAAPATGTGSLLGALMPFAILLGVMYFMVIRPQKAQQKKRETMMANLRKGNRIVTVGGIFGEIIDIKDDAVIVNVSQGPERIVVRMAKWAVQDVIGKDNSPKEKEAPEA
jgi:preprotein translocase subunit YajC